MNLFKIYLDKIKKSINKNKKLIGPISSDDLSLIVIESPPDKFNYDLSSNAAMVLSKIIKENPRMIAEKLKNIFEKEINDFSEISIAGPGFMNFKFSLKKFIKIFENIFKTKKKFGSNKQTKKFNIEFVSANPTGPMRVIVEVQFLVMFCQIYSSLMETKLQKNLYKRLWKTSE